MPKNCEWCHKRLPVYRMVFWHYDEVTKLDVCGTCKFTIQKDFVVNCIRRLRTEKKKTS